MEVTYVPIPLNQIKIVTSNNKGENGGVAQTSQSGLHKGGEDGQPVGPSGFTTTIGMKKNAMKKGS